MKKLLLLSIVIFTTQTWAQKKNWSFSFMVTHAFGGPVKSVDKAMDEQGFAGTYRFGFFGLVSTQTYPIIDRSAAVYLFRGSKRQTSRRSYFFVAGISNAGRIFGFRSDSTTFGNYASFKYRIYQLAGGFEYDLPHSWLKLGIGPSLYLLTYGSAFPPNPQNNSRLVPGVTANARLPLGKQKRSFGLELFSEINLAPNAKTRELKESGSSIPLSENHVTMIHGAAGILLTVRG